jgi:hypothetical protein
MNKVIWRLHRSQAWFAVTALAATAVVILVSGLKTYQDYHLMQKCAGASWCGIVGISSGTGLISHSIAGSILVLPGLLAMFWGVPLVAKELEEGTHVLAWTQSITRRRWIATNLGWALLASAILGAGMSVLLTWWRGPANALYGRLGTAFDIQGFVPVAYCVFGVTLGIAAGVLLKRVLPALAVTLGLLVAVRAAVAISLRSHFLTPISLTFRGNPDVLRFGALSKVWLLSERTVDAAGHIVDPESAWQAVCQTGASTNQSISNCLAAHGYRTIFVFQPESRFWAFQAVESAIFLALSILLVTFTYRRLSRRDA